MVPDFRWDGGVEHFLKGLDDYLAPALLVAALEVAEPDAGKVFHPLEIGDRHATGVKVSVWDDDGAFFAENLVGGVGDRAVGRLGDERGLDAGGIVVVDDGFHRGRDEDVAVGLEQ